MPRPVDRNATFIPGLDGLRTVAVAVVVLFHLGVSGVGGGLLGVGVFFTLSGYLITANLMRAWRKRGSLGLKTFWLRRFRRLAPAMLVTLAAVPVLTGALERGSLGDRLGEAVSALFYVNNWHMILDGSSYFDNFNGPGPLDHMWSLSVEEQFYLVWPLVLLGLLTLGMKVTKGKSRGMTVALGGALVLAVASFALMWLIATPGFDNTRAYEGTDTRAGGLLVGAALAVWLAVRSDRGQSVVPSRVTALVAGAVGVAGILAMVLLVDEHDMFLYRGGIALLSLASVAAIFAVLRTGGMWSTVLGCAPLRWLGERSYGIYLWHMPVIAFLPDGWLQEQPWLSGALVAVLSVGIAAVSWRILEDPVRRHGVVEPVKRWWSALAAARSGTRTTVGPYIAQTYLGSAAVVVLGAVLVIGAPSVIAGAGRDDDAPPSMAAVTGPAAPAVPDEETAETPATPAADGRTACTRVIHVGDSTSLGMFDPGQVPAEGDVATSRYVARGADDIVTSVFGARSTTEGWNEYPAATDSVAELLGNGQPGGTCWVIATGVNDAANYAVGADLNGEQRIRTMMDLLAGQRVMWATTASDMDSGPWDNANMETFNDVLRRVATDYPGLAVYDWASEVSPHREWFLEGDGVHYNATGNAERGLRFAAALAAAFPEGQDADPAGKVVTSGL